MKTTAELIQAALTNLRLAEMQLEKASTQHLTPHSVHATEIMAIRSDIADSIHRLERV